MSHTYRGPTREQYRRTMRRLRQQNRLSYMSSEQRQTQRFEDQKERARIIRLWEQSIDFFADSGGTSDTDQSKEANDGPAK